MTVQQQASTRQRPTQQLKRCSQRATNVQPPMQSQNEIFPSFACDLQTHSSNQTNHRTT